MIRFLCDFLKLLFSAAAPPGRKAPSIVAMVRGVSAVALAMAVATLVCGVKFADAQDGTVGETFQSRLMTLQAELRDRQSANKASIPEMIGKYEQLIVSSGNAPRVGYAIRDLAGLYAMNNDDQARPIGNSLDKAISLFEQVRQLSPRGTDLWTEASFGLAYQLRRQAITVQSLPMARSVLNEIRESSSSLPNADLRLKEQMVLQAAAERNFDAAESACRELLALGGPGAGAENLALLRRCQQIAVSTLLSDIVRTSDPERSSTEWFDKLAADFPQHDFVRERVAIYRGQLSASRPRAPATIGPFILVNGAFVATWIVYVAVRAYQQRCRVVPIDNPGSIH